MRKDAKKGFFKALNFSEEFQHQEPRLTDRTASNLTPRASAGLHGNKGQALYVAANAAMQKLAAEMRALSRPIPGIALDFPIVVGAGRLADIRNVAELQLNTGRGFGVISFAKLETLLAKLRAMFSVFPIPKNNLCFFPLPKCS